MHSEILLSTLLFSASAFAQLSSTVNTQCFTRYSSVKPQNIRTTTFGTSTTKTATKLVTTTRRATVTPARVTSTRLTTKTNIGTRTATGSTDITTSTSTIISVVPKIEITSIVITATTTATETAEGTSTVAAPTGFVGASDELGYVAKRGAIAERRNAIVEERAAASTNFYLPTIAPVAKKNQARQATNRVQFPFAVQCTRSVTFFTTKTSTKTATGTVTSTLATPTVFVTSTAIATRTTTVTPAVTTRTVLSTSFTTTTSTSTISTRTISVVTETVEVAEATAFAQCDASNIINSAQGQSIGTVSYNPAFRLQSVGVTSDGDEIDTTGVACCVQCAQTANCAGFAQAPASQGSTCFNLITDGRCATRQTFGDLYRYYGTAGESYLVGNGQCGYLGAAAGPPPS